MKTTKLLYLLVTLYQTHFVVGKSIHARSTTELTNEEESCVLELHLNKNEIQLMNNRDIAPEDDENFNKFLTCYWKKMGWEDADGKINYELLHQDMLQAIICEIGNVDPQLKMMLQLLLETVIINCRDNISNTVTDFIVPKFQNCIVNDLEKLIERSNDY